MTISLVCLDMAGTTVADDGTVMRAFDAAMHAVGLSPESAEWGPAVDLVIATMGQSKIEVFTRILGNPDRAEQANQAFEDAYSAIVDAGGIEEIPGAADAIQRLRAAEVKVCLTTGFSPATRDGILRTLDWTGLVDLALSPADVGRGRPWPDLIWSAALRLGIDAAADIAVVGDTASDVECGRRSGAGLVVGVLSGAGTAGQLHSAGADKVIADVTGLLSLPGFESLTAKPSLSSS